MINSEIIDGILLKEKFLNKVYRNFFYVDEN